MSSLDLSLTNLTYCQHWDRGHQSMTRKSLALGSYHSSCCLGTACKNSSPIWPCHSFEEFVQTPCLQDSSLPLEGHELGCSHEFMMCIDILILQKFKRWSLLNKELQEYMWKMMVHSCWFAQALQWGLIHCIWYHQLPLQYLHQQHHLRHRPTSLQACWWLQGMP